MDDVTPSAALIPAQPVATETNPAAPFPPADSSPVFVPPSVTDPVSNLDFLPVDDAFTLEMRSESIEQLDGGDALRRGESERIEAGRSQTNADLVAGRDRVHVQGRLHEHTGHGFAEQAAHLHTTVDGTLDVHAGSEDTVLLAGHMNDLWDGGTAIVVSMTDDTVAGGGIRVTPPLDLWVHGLTGAGVDAKGLLGPRRLRPPREARERKPLPGHSARPPPHPAPCRRMLRLLDAPGHSA